MTFIDCSPGSHVPLESAMCSALVISEDREQGKISKVLKMISSPYRTTHSRESVCVFCLFFFHVRHHKM